ncbi:MAG: ABC transporter permease [Halieaceae bacterium]|jgi:oligopeptide transport system permease protein|nr:ABC transporter permease [Halieaceae bacterium]
MNAYTPTADDFTPLDIAREGDRIDRPSLSYWQDVWRRLKRNRRALLSLYIVVFLLLFTLAGPLIWRVDPALQDLEQISQPPNTGRYALVIDGSTPLPTLDTAPVPSPSFDPDIAPPNLRLLAPANSEGVNLAWDPVPGAEGYQIYRHELEPRDADDLGLPLVQLLPFEHSYQDRLGLETRRYYYSVTALHRGQESRAYSTVAVDVAQAILLAEARFRGLVDPDTPDSEAVGSRVRLESHPLGTDYLGRDMLARLMWGARTSLFIGICAPLLYVAIGLVYGGLAGYSGGRTDDVMMRFADFVIALPFLLFMILFKIAFGLGPGESGIGPMLLALVLLSWPATARLVRGQVLQIREEAYIAAARMMGARAPYLVFRHILPNVMGVLLVSLTFAIPTAIFIEAFLSFIGMGVVPPTPSWGSMCNDGIRTMLSHPHELLFPALFISVTVLAFNLLGDGLRDAMDARMRSDT